MNLPIVLSGLTTGSLLAAGLWLLFRLFPRIAPDIRAWSWRLLLLKLAISAFAIGQVSLHLLPASQSVAPRHSNPPSVGALLKPTFETTPVAIIEDRSHESAPAAIRRAPEQTATHYEMFGIALWGVGVAFLFARALFVTIRTRRALQAGVPVADPEILARLEALSDSSHLPRPPRLVSFESAVSPMVFGIWRPIIVLPARLVSGSSGELELALGHEIAHIRRRDLAWMAIAWLVRTALFFNPVVWLAEMELRAAQESATDQEAVWLTGASVFAYGEMLLGAMRPDKTMVRPTGLAMFDSFRNAHRRLRAMKHFSERPRSTRRVSIATLVGVGIACLPTYLIVPASAASKPLPKPKEKTEASLPQSDPIPVKSVKEGTGHSKATSSVKSKKIGKELGRGTSAPLAQARVRAVATQKPEPNISFVEEKVGANLANGPASVEMKEALDEFNARVNSLIQTQDARIAEYRLGADQREQEAQQRESEAQQRKREGIQRARAALLREQVIEENEKDNYQVTAPGQREADARTRQADGRQKDADRYQGVLDQKQKATDQWQREFDDNSIAAIRKETQQDIAAARSKYQKRLAERIADDSSRRREAEDAVAYSQAQVNIKTGSGLHTVRAASGLSFAIPDGYEVVAVRTVGKNSYSVVLRHKKA